MCQMRELICSAESLQRTVILSPKSLLGEARHTLTWWAEGPPTPHLPQKMPLRMTKGLCQSGWEHWDHRSDYREAAGESEKEARLWGQRSEWGNCWPVRGQRVTGQRMRTASGSWKRPGNGFSLEAQEDPALLTLDCRPQRILTSRTARQQIFPIYPSLWWFVTAEIGDWYTSLNQFIATVHGTTQTKHLDRLFTKIGRIVITTLVYYLSPGLSPGLTPLLWPSKVLHLIYILISLHFKTPSDFFAT